MTGDVQSDVESGSELLSAAEEKEKSQYVVISAVRDEERHLRSTIESMLRQTILPAEWVIVNDGSSDNTGKIIDEYAASHSWIRSVHRPNRGFRKSGGGVVEAFNEGYRTLAAKQWDYIVKLDGDLSFSFDYFERCFERFAKESTLGIGGGIISYITDGKEQLEDCPRFHVRGATKIYRRECWNALGGLWPAPGWDTIDEIKASSLGWRTSSFRDLHLVHHRLTGSADGLWGGFVKNGRANYICGYHPLFMIIKCIRRLALKPVVVGSLALMYGFISGYAKRIPQVNDPEMISYLRNQQLRRLFGRDSIWH